MAAPETGRHEQDICINNDETRGISHGSDTNGCLCCMPQDQFRLMVCEALREWMLFSLPRAPGQIDVAPNQRMNNAEIRYGSPLTPVTPATAEGLYDPIDRAARIG